MSVLKRLPETVIIGLVLLMAGCDDEASKNVNGTNKKDKETETKDTDTEKTDNSGAACEGFSDYLDDCEMGAITKGTMNGFCEGFDQIFIDSFMDALMPCMTEMSCEDFEALIAEEDVVDTDTTSTELGPVEICMASAFVLAEPEEANTAFKEHYCEYAVECDPNTSEAACSLEFTPMGEMYVFLVLEETYVSQIDACINPKPTCAEAETVVECIEGVGNDIGQTFEEMMI